MYRRRLQPRDRIAFGFDSFLDVVANVIGIIIRLILVAWVGGRSYSALMQWKEAPPPDATALPAPRPEDDPLSQQIAKSQRDIEAARARLLAQMRDLDLAQRRRQQVQAQLASLDRERDSVERQQQDLALAGGDRERVARLAALSMDELRRRQQALLGEIKKLEAQPAPHKELRFRTPVSRTVHADEVFFECRGGRVAFIDLQAFLQEVQGKLQDAVGELRTSWKVAYATRPVGAFRLRYVVERQPDAIEAFGPGAKPGTDGGFRYGVSEWVVEGVTPERGETLETSLAPDSQFRRLVDALDASTVITFWVYPDSFELFRRLRDACYERGLEIAGRPLPFGAPIAASRHGTASRGQ
ncbi:MAG: hypothetical protein L0Y71_04715 [Gemmataceae bacterium]|nr:hypothetical protein [Gemmataceae bacterium]